MVSAWYPDGCLTSGSSTWFFGMKGGGQLDGRIAGMSWGRVGIYCSADSCLCISFNIISYVTWTLEGWHNERAIGTCYILLETVA